MMTTSGDRPVPSLPTETDRRRFLTWAGVLGASGVFVVTSLAAPTTASAATASTTPADAPAGEHDGDIAILNFALTLEHVQADFHARGPRPGLLDAAQLAAIGPIAAHEREHVAALTRAVTALGGNPVRKPKIRYAAGTFESRQAFLTTGAQLAELAVQAYHGQVPLVRDPVVLAWAAAMAGVESRHATILAVLSGADPLPAHLESHASARSVLAQVEPMIG